MSIREEISQEFVQDIDDEDTEILAVSPALDNPMNAALLVQEVHGPEPTVPSNKSNRELWNNPTRVGSRILCRLERNTDQFRTCYRFYIEQGNDVEKVLMTAYRKVGEYKFIIMGNEEDGSEVPIAKVKTNFLGNLFKVYEYDKVLGEEIASILYELNVAGPKQPRKLKVFVPLINENGQPFKLKHDYPGLDLQSLSKDSTAPVVTMLNKLPQWSEGNSDLKKEAQAYVLNFQGRVQLSSVKNFQIVHPKDLYYIVLQFGKSILNIKIASDQWFNVDIRYPFSLLQAFGIILTSFDSKVACE